MLFEESEYKATRKTLKQLLLHVVHVYPRSSAEAILRNKELLKTYGKMKTRTDTLGNAEKVNMEEILQSLEREHNCSTNLQDDMEFDSDNKTTVHDNTIVPHHSMTRASGQGSKNMITTYRKFPLVLVPEGKVVTKEGQEIHFLEYFRQNRGVLMGIYLVGVDLYGYLTVGVFEHEAAEAMSTLYGFRNILIEHFDTVTVDRVWEENGVCTPAIIDQVMGATVALNTVKKELMCV